MRLWVVAFTAILVATGQAASAEDSSLPVRTFCANVELSYLTCKLKGEIALLNGDFPGLQSCIDEQQETIKPYYKPALTSMKGNASAVAMLKDTYAAVLSAFDELLPNGDELVGLYKARIAEAGDDIARRCKRLEVETQ